MSAKTLHLRGTRSKCHSCTKWMKLRDVCVCTVQLLVLEKKHGIREEAKKRGAVTAVEWFEGTLLQDIVRTVHALRAVTAVHPFTAALPWSIHRSYTNRFLQESAMKLSRIKEWNKDFSIVLLCKEIICSSKLATQ